MSDFKSYNQSRQGEQQPQGGKTDSAEKQPNVEQTANLAAEIAKAFYGKSTKDIWQTILAQAEQGKRDGTLTNEDLDNFYRTVYPLVDGFKRQKLKSVIAKLKEI